jgi:hypothetical protein
MAAFPPDLHSLGAYRAPSNHEELTMSEEGLTITEAKETLRHLRQHNPTQAVFCWGPVGVGKSQMVAQLCAELNIGMLDMRLSQMDPPDLRGLPYRDGTQSKYAPPDELPKEGEGILFLDEANAASRATSAAAMQLVLDRQLGQYRVPEGWSVWAAGNRLSDKSVANAMPAALANRYLHLQIRYDLNTLVEYGLGQGWDPIMLQFLRFRPEFLYQPPEGREIEAFPSARAWEMVHNSGAMSAAPAIRQRLVRGALGVGPMLELEAFVELMGDLPVLDTILLSPHSAQLPKTVAVKHALIGALAKAADVNNMDAILSYLERLASREWETAFMSFVAIQKPELMQTSRAIRWNVRNQDLRTA